MMCDWCERLGRFMEVMLADRGGGYVVGHACPKCRRKYKLEKYDQKWADNY